MAKWKSMTLTPHLDIARISATVALPQGGVDKPLSTLNHFSTPHRTVYTIKYYTQTNLQFTDKSVKS